MSVEVQRLGAGNGASAFEAMVQGLGAADAAPAVLPAAATAAWPCRACQARAWTPDNLARLYPARAFDLGEESGATCTIADLVAAGDPARYIFDALPAAGDALLGDYAAPPGAPCAPEQDYLHYMVTSPPLRPRFRWFLVGVRGSGFVAHVDPWGTCAWNALAHGRKRWAVLPPDTPPQAVFPGYDAGAGQPLPSHLATARGWFEHALPQLLRAPPPGLRCFTQEEGEVVLLPAGWWHCAETLSPVSVGVTQNWLPREGLERELAKLGPASALAAAWRSRAAAALGARGEGVGAGV